MENKEELLEDFIKRLTIKLANECLKFYEADEKNKDVGRTFTMRQILDYCKDARKEMGVE